MINKHEIPILEFDDNPQAVIMPTHDDLGLDLPPRCVYGFLEEEVERYAISVGAEKVGEFVSATKTYPVYVMTYNGKKICGSSLRPAAATAIYGLYWLWRQANHINWNLWRLGRYARECFFDSDESFAR